jgi:hypothetical protein
MALGTLTTNASYRVLAEIFYEGPIVTRGRRRGSTDPGEQMQVDWAVIRRGSDRLSVFVATLAPSGSVPASFRLSR